MGNVERRDSEATLERRGEGGGGGPRFPVPSKKLLVHTPSSSFFMEGLPHNSDCAQATCTSSGSPDTGGSPHTLLQLGCRVCERFLPKSTILWRETL